jgi:hypothetical protein
MISGALQHNEKGLLILRELVFSTDNVLRVYESEIEEFVEN